MSDIRNKYNHLVDEIASLKIKTGRVNDSILLIAVSKGKSIQAIEEVYALGCHDFGENRPLEALEKIQKLPQIPHWHFIGNIQKNKVRKLVGNFTLIHSVDSFEIAKKISDVSSEENVITSILIQVNTSGEESKQGITPQNCFDTFDSYLRLPSIEIQGLMTMAPLTDDDSIIRKAFRDLKELLIKLNHRYGTELKHLSMGMTHDYKIAIEEGATLLRIGSKIFN